MTSNEATLAADCSHSRPLQSHRNLHSRLVDAVPRNHFPGHCMKPGTTLGMQISLQISTCIATEHAEHDLTNLHTGCKARLRSSYNAELLSMPWRTITADDQARDRLVADIHHNVQHNFEGHGLTRLHTPCNARLRSSCNTET